MKKPPTASFFIHLLFAGLLLTSCNGKKNGYSVSYPAIGYTLQLPNTVHVQEMYQNKLMTGGIYRNVDSAGINTERDFRESETDSSAIIRDEVIKNPGYFFSALKKKTSWNLNFTVIVSAKWQDTAVVYDLNRIRQADFQERYVFGEGRDSSFYTGNTCVEIEKDGKKLFKISDADTTNITYTGMIGKYWFMFQFFGSSKESSSMEEIWNQSHFK